MDLETLNERTFPAPPPPKRRLLRGGVLAVGGLAAVPVVLFLGLYLYLRVFQLVFPGVTVGGAPIDGLTHSEAVQELDRIWNRDFLVTAVDAMTPEDAWLVLPGEFGLGVDADLTADAAYAFGREEGLVAGLGQLADGLISGVDITPVVVIDADRARRALVEWGERLSQPAMDADVYLAEADIVTVAAESGKMLDVDATLLLLESDPADILLDYRFIPLLTVAVDPALTEVDDAVERIRSYLHSPPQVQAFDPVTGEHLDWTPAPEEMAYWINIVREDDHLDVMIDEEGVEAYLRDQNDGLGSERGIDVAAAVPEILEVMESGEAVSLRVYYNPTEYVVRGSDNIISIAFDVGIPYWRIQEANPMIAVHGLSVGEAIVIPPRDANLVVPPVENKRIVISISQQRMWTYENGSLLNEYVVSTGMANSPTMPGIFQVQIHILNAYGENWDLYMPHFLGIYEAVPGFMNGIHGLPLLSSGVRLWADVLGSPASYGCIILDLDAAEVVYNWAENGVVVEILR